LFSDWPGKSDNFSDFLNCSSGLSRTVHLGWPLSFFF
jgi:hypothetical protein